MDMPEVPRSRIWIFVDWKQAHRGQAPEGLINVLQRTRLVARLPHHPRREKMRDAKVASIAAIAQKYALMLVWQALRVQQPAHNFHGVDFWAWRPAQQAAPLAPIFLVANW